MIDNFVCNPRFDTKYLMVDVNQFSINIFI